MGTSTRFGLAVLVTGFAFSSAAPSAVGNDQDYGYCTVKIGSSTQLAQVVSTVYRVRAGTYHVGVANSFRDYVDANFSSGASGSPICGTSTPTWQQAEDERNAYIGRLRREGWNVHVVNWAYYGD